MQAVSYVFGLETTLGQFQAMNEAFVESVAFVAMVARSSVRILQEDA